MVGGGGGSDTHTDGLGGWVVGGCLLFCQLSVSQLHGWVSVGEFVGEAWYVLYKPRERDFETRLGVFNCSSIRG